MLQVATFDVTSVAAAVQMHTTTGITDILAPHVQMHAHVVVQALEQVIRKRVNLYFRRKTNTK